MPPGVLVVGTTDPVVSGGDVVVVAGSEAVTGLVLSVSAQRCRPMDAASVHATY